MRPLLILTALAALAAAGPTASEPSAPSSPTSAAPTATVLTGATVEGEQEAVMGQHFDKPMPEPNPSVRLFERLTIERWQAHLDARASGAKPSLCTRVKHL